MKCKPIRYGERWQCRRCGYCFKTPAANAPHKTCDHPGWGDRLANGLAFLGITKARVSTVKRFVTRSNAGCGCQARQEIVNEIGDVPQTLWQRLFPPPLPFITK